MKIDSALATRAASCVAHGAELASILALPCLVLAGVVAGGINNASNVYAGLSDFAYLTLMLLSWAPFVGAGICIHLLLFQRERWYEGLGRPQPLRLQILRLALIVFLWACTFWMGTVGGHVWRISNLGAALVKCALSLVLARLAYRGAFSMVGRSDEATTGDTSGTAMTALVPSQNASAAEGRNYTFPWSRPGAGLDTLAGMSGLKSELHMALKGFQDYGSNGAVCDRNGILLSGPPGNGKTTFALAIAAELGLPLVKLGCQDLTSKYVNESAAVIKALFEQAADQPCVVFFDEFDSIAQSRGASNMHNEDRKIVTTLLSELDTARSRRIVIVAATNYVDQIDAAIARDGRFDFRIDVPYPDLQARLAILKGLLGRYGVQAQDSVLEHVARLWERRSSAFIEATVKRLRDAGRGLEGSLARTEDFKMASREASRRASAIPAEGARLSEIVLPSSVRTEAQSLVYRLKHWEEIAERGGEPPSGVLLYGPPGTGKTNFVRALARELEYWHVFEVNACDVLQNPRRFRDTVEMAGNHRPAIVFLDEADELLRERTFSAAGGATNEILKTMDGMMGKIPEVVFIAATNHAQVIDSAALRGGRFAEKIFMGRLSGDDLVRFLQHEFAGRAQVKFSDDLSPQALASRLCEAAPSDAIGLLRKAINYTFTQDGGARPVCMGDIDRALESMNL